MSNELDELRRRIWALERMVAQLAAERRDILLAQQNALATDYTGGSCERCGSWGALENPPQCGSPIDCPHGFGGEK